MESPEVTHELLEVMDRLGREDQRRVLDFARSLAGEAPRGKPGRGLLRHVRAIPPEEVDRVSAAIEEGCEQIDVDSWKAPEL